MRNMGIDPGVETRNFSFQSLFNRLKKKFENEPRASIKIWGLKITFIPFALFMAFWTLVLGPFEIFYLLMPILWVVVIRFGIAVFTNRLLTKVFYKNQKLNEKLWKSPAHKTIIGREVTLDFRIFLTRIKTFKFVNLLKWVWKKKLEIPKMLIMKVLVNCANFLLLLGITKLLLERMGFTNHGLHFTPGGFLFKLGMITAFAIALALPYAALEGFFFTESMESMVEQMHDLAMNSEENGVTDPIQEIGASLDFESHELETARRNS